jgi:hypothetical protein
MRDRITQSIVSCCLFPEKIYSVAGTEGAGTRERR